MQVVVATHGHCFDGLASAVLFTRLLRALEGSRAEFTYHACGYGYAQPKPDESMLRGDQNAILDFRLTPSERVGWLFDHHRTAFQLPGAEALFVARGNQGRMYVDADYPSCAKLIADVSRKRFGVHDPNLDELVAWADRVDAARFQSPQDAIDQQDPIKRLVSVVEHCAEDKFIARQVPELLSKPLLEVATSREIRKRYAPLGRRQRRVVELLRARCERRGLRLGRATGQGSQSAGGLQPVVPTTPGSGPEQRLRPLRGRRARPRRSHPVRHRRAGIRTSRCGTNRE
jgi:hypothetical protein